MYWALFNGFSHFITRIIIIIIIIITSNAQKLEKYYPNHFPDKNILLFMENLTDFRKTVETSVGPRMEVVYSLRTHR